MATPTREQTMEQIRGQLAIANAQELLQVMILKKKKNETSISNQSLSFFLCFVP